jgi:fibronectin-binding autotransporter adhesin
MKKSIHSAFAASLLLGAASTSQAQNLFWGGVSGTWTGTQNWYTDAAGTVVSGSVPNAGNDVIFNITPSLALTSTASMTTGTTTVHGMTFRSSGTTVVSQGGSTRSLLIGGGGITLDSGAGNVTFGVSSNALRVEAVEDQTWTNNSSSTLNVRSLMAANLATGPVTVTLNAASSGNITFSLATTDSYNPLTPKALGLVVDSVGTGTVVLQNSTYSGGTEIKRGILAANGNMGSGAVTFGNTSGSADVRIHLTGAAANDITVRAGSSGAAALTGANNADYQGDIVLNRDVTFGSLSSSTATVTYSGDISGSGGISVVRLGSASPVVVLSGNNTYTGKTTITAGTVVADSLNSVVGGSASSSLGAPITSENATILMSTVGGATLRYVGAGETTDRAIEIGGSIGTTIEQAGTGTLKFTSDLQNSGAGSRTLTLQGSTAGVGEFAGAINNIGTGTNVGVTKTGSGTWRLSGTTSTYAGSTSITGGVLEVTKLANQGSASSLGFGTASVTSISFGGVNPGGTLRYIGTGDSTNRGLNIGSAGATLDASGSGAVSFTRTSAPAYGSSNVATSLTLTGTNKDLNTYAANQNNNGTGAVSLIKDGEGTWVLTGNSTYTGATTINAGTLLVDGSLAAGSAVALNSAILGGSGTANGLVTTSGTGSTISPGNSPGTLTLAGGLNADAGATFVFELGTTSDVLSLGSGTLTGSSFAGGLVFNFVDAGGLLAGNPYTIITFGSATGLDYSDLVANTLPSGYVLDSSFGTGGFQINGNGIQVQFEIVPEPSTVLLMIGGVTVVMAMRRRRQS